MDSTELKGTDTSPRPDTMSRLVIGLSLIAAGVLFTLDNFGLVDDQGPLEVLAARPRRRRRHEARRTLVFRGNDPHRARRALFLRTFGLLHFRLSYLFPLILVFIGLAHRLRATPGRAHRGTRRRIPAAR